MGKEARSEGNGKLEFTSKDALQMISSGKYKHRKMIAIIPALERSVSRWHKIVAQRSLCPYFCCVSFEAWPSARKLARRLRRVVRFLQEQGAIKKDVKTD